MEWLVHSAEIWIEIPDRGNRFRCWCEATEGVSQRHQQPPTPLATHGMTLLANPSLSSAQLLGKMSRLR
jgi:hypothetical protein